MTMIPGRHACDTAQSSATRRTGGAAPCDRCQLSGSALCRAIRSDAGKAGIAQACGQPARLRRVRRDAMVFEQGEAPGVLGVLRRGFLRKERISSEGRRTILDMAVPGDIVGAMPGRSAGFTLEAASDAEICVFDADTAQRMAQRNPAFRRQVLRDATEQLDRQLQLTWLRGALTSRERIIAFLLLCARIMPVEPQPDGSLIVTIEMGRRDWADLSNTTVESISRTLGHLAEKGLVEKLTPRRLRLREPGLLAQLAGLDPDLDQLLSKGTGQRGGPARNSPRLLAG